MTVGYIVCEKFVKLFWNHKKDTNQIEIDSPIVKLRYKGFTIDLVNESYNSLGHSDNSFGYDFIYQDEESAIYQSTKHGIRIFQEDEIYKSAIVCAVAGSTRIHNRSAIIVDIEDWNHTKYKLSFDGDTL